MQTAGSGPDPPSTAIFATLPATASDHPGNLGSIVSSLNRTFKILIGTIVFVLLFIPPTNACHENKVTLRVAVSASSNKVHLNPPGVVPFFFFGFPFHSCRTGSDEVSFTFGSTRFYDVGTTVTLEAIPEERWEFSNWTGSCSGNGICNVNLTEDKSVVANFSFLGPAKLSVSVSVGVGFGNGMVTSTPAGIECSSFSFDPLFGEPTPGCSADYDVGTVVTLLATPQKGSFFDRWDSACFGVVEATCQITMDFDRSASAIFRECVRGINLPSCVIAMPWLELLLLDD